MRLALALVIAVAIAVAAFAAARDDASDAETGTVTLVGDSLNVGIEPYLGAALPGWTIDAHDRVGRITAEGVAELRSLGGEPAPTLVISLGTNDADGTEAEFRALVGDVLELVGARCVVWATIVRGGEPRTGFNNVLREAESTHRNLRLVDWASLVEDDDTLLASDLVHGSPDGYGRRAEETADAVRACAA
jgi:hypothetical protein